MENFFTKLDSLAGIETENKNALWLERLAFIFLVLMTLFAPHSIAATQTAMSLGWLFWFARYFVRPRPKFIRTALFIPLSIFLGWSVLTAVFSYAPDISIDKLRGVVLLIIFFFAVNNLRTIRAAKFLALALIFSCMVNVIWTPINRLIGRGVEIQNIKTESLLAKAKLQEGDTLLKANNEKISNPEELLKKIEQNDKTTIYFYRPDFYFAVDVEKSDLLKGENALEKLGIGGWKKSRNWRSSGFFGQYATYAEVLQLIASLAFGLFIAGFGRTRMRESEGGSERAKERGSEGARKFSDKYTSSVSPSFLLFICVGLMALALLLTVTRASQAAFMISAFLIVLLGASRKFILIAVLVAVPVIVGGLFFLQQSREIGFLDATDNSIKWRQTVYREGFDLWTKNARNFTLGVGMDSIKRYKEEWELFDDGKLPPGHFHSTPLQLLVERGFPALLFWLWILAVYGFRLLKSLRQNKFHDWIEKGIILGCFGGLVGFFMSSLVHYNFGDSEVTMVFYLLMALAMRIVSREKFKAAEAA